MIYSHLRPLVLIGTLFFSTPIFALSEKDQESYQKAKTLYSSGDFTQSYAILSNLYLEALDNPELNFYLGRCAYETGDYTSALAAFDRVEMLEQGNQRNQIEHARTQYKAQLFPEAKESFQALLQSDQLSESTRKTLQSYLSAIDKQEHRSGFKAIGRAGFLYDSNVNFGSADDTYTIIYGTYSATKPISDTAHEESVGFTHLYDFGAQGGAILRNQASLYNRHYSDEHDYDLTFLSYNPALLYSDGQSTYELVGGIGQIMLGGKEYYTLYSLQPVWMYDSSPSLQRTLSLKIGRKNYTQTTDNDLDSRWIEMKGNMAYGISAYSKIEGTLFASRQIKDNGTRIDVNYNEIGGSALYTNQVLPNTIVQADVSFKKRYYDDYSPLFHSYRTDQTLYGSINFIQRLNDSISLELMGNYNHTDSTISVYQFDKYTLSLSLSTRF